MFLFLLFFFPHTHLSIYTRSLSHLSLFLFFFNKLDQIFLLSLQKSAPLFVSIPFLNSPSPTTPVHHTSLLFPWHIFQRTNKKNKKMMMMEEQEADWDLHAVVRGFTTTTTTTTTSAEAVAENPQPQPQPTPLCLTYSSASSSAPPYGESEGLLSRIVDPIGGIGGIGGGIGDGLDDLFKPFCPDLLPFNNPTPTTTMAAVCSSESGVLGEFMEQHHHQQQQTRQQFHQQTPPPPQLKEERLLVQQQMQGQLNMSQVMFGAAAPAVAATSLVSGATHQSQRIVAASPAPQTQRAKKRKNVMKKVCHVPAEGLSSDMWAWRKYGQKPIKGSPYPRGYYRCSSSKGCLARKQVERNRSDPKMFIVTYTAEHNHPMPTHRNSLAGSTRQKASTGQSQSGGGATAGGDTGSPTSTSTTTTTPPTAPNSSSSPTTSLSPVNDYEDLLKDDDDENEMGLSDMILKDDDIFTGFEDLDGFDPVGDCFPDEFTTSLDFPWLANGSSTATTAAGGS